MSENVLQKGKKDLKRRNLKIYQNEKLHARVDTKILAREIRKEMHHLQIFFSRVEWRCPTSEPS